MQKHINDALLYGTSTGRFKFKSDPDTGIGGSGGDVKFVGVDLASGPDRTGHVALVIVDSAFRPATRETLAMIEADDKQIAKDMLAEGKARERKVLDAALADVFAEATEETRVGKALQFRAPMTSMMGCITQRGVPM